MVMFYFDVIPPMAERISPMTPSAESGVAICGITDEDTTPLMCDDLILIRAAWPHIIGHANAPDTLWQKLRSQGECVARVSPSVKSRRPSAPYGWDVLGDVPGALRFPCSIANRKCQLMRVHVRRETVRVDLSVANWHVVTAPPVFEAFSSQMRQLPLWAGARSTLRGRPGPPSQ